jgi:large repetitive protein
LTAYDASGAQETLSGGAGGLNEPTGIAFDPANGLFYIVNFGAAALTAYDTTGLRQTLSATTGLNEPFGVAYNPKNSWLYVANRGSSTITAYDASGAQQTVSGTFTNVNAPFGITIVP